MSTRASLVYPKDGEGSWGFYLELLDDTVHFEINAAGISIDMELMPISQWQALGFPNRFAVPNTVSTDLMVEHKNKLEIALDESVKLQSHYAQLLNQYDGGERMTFDSAENWIKRLQALKLA